MRYWKARGGRRPKIRNRDETLWDPILHFRTDGNLEVLFIYTSKNFRLGG